jgi:hypothetical protein
MVDPDFAGENVEKARLDALASGDADLLAVARQYRAAMTAHSTDVDSGKVSGCAAVAGFAKKAGGAKQREEVAKFATLDAEGLFATPFDDKRPQPPRPVEPVGQPSAANVEWKTAPAGLVVIPASYSVTRSPDGRDDFAARRHSQLQPYRKLAGRMVPFSRVGDVAGVCAALADEFPHLAGLAERIVREVASKPHVSFRPILLHGSPGSGKTRFARRLCTALATDSVVYPCGGADDSSIGGTSCQWSSGRTSVPLQTVVRSGLANPCIILDEVEKVGTSRHNGNLSDVILGLTETESSGAYFDPFLEVEVDLSGVLWIATANAIGEVASPLLDRFRSLEVPLPDVEHAPSLVRSMALDIARSQGLAPQWAYRFSDGEVDAIAEAWGGGSLRRLRSLMEKVVAALDSNTSILH